MNLSQLRTLVAISRHDSFVGAANALFITATAVSHQMRNLEQELGVELFDRSTRPPRLNAHARALVAQGSKLLQEFDALANSARSPGEVSGRLALGCVTGVSSQLIPNALANLRISHPGVQIRMIEGFSEALANQVRTHELDAAIVSELPDADPALQSMLITEEPLMLVAAASLRKTGLGWRDLLLQNPFIRINRHTGVGSLIDRGLRKNGLVLHESMELDSSSVVVAMAKAGLGVGIVPGGTLVKESPDELLILPFGEPQVMRNVVLVERGNNQRSDLSKLVYEALRALTAGHTQ